MQSAKVELLAGRNVLVTGSDGVGRTALVEAVGYAKEVSWRALAGHVKSYAEFARRFRDEAMEVSGVLFVSKLDLLEALCSHPELLWEDGDCDLSGDATPIDVLSDIGDKSSTTILATASEKNFAKTAALLGRTSVIRLSPLNVEQTVAVLRANRKHFESSFEVRLGESAITATPRLCEIYTPLGVLPQQAMDVLSEACRAAQNGKQALVTDEDIFHVLSCWTRIPMEHLRQNRHKRTQNIKRVVSAHNLSHVHRVMSEHNLGEVKKAKLPTGSCLSGMRAGSEASSLSSESNAVFI